MVAFSPIHTSQRSPADLIVTGWWIKDDRQTQYPFAGEPGPTPSSPSREHRSWPTACGWRMARCVGCQTGESPRQPRHLPTEVTSSDQGIVQIQAKTAYVVFPCTVEVTTSGLNDYADGLDSLLRIALEKTVVSQGSSKTELKPFSLPVELQASGLKVPNAGEGTCLCVWLLIFIDNDLNVLVCMSSGLVSRRRGR